MNLCGMVSYLIHIRNNLAKFSVQDFPLWKNTVEGLESKIKSKEDCTFTLLKETFITDVGLKIAHVNEIVNSPLDISNRWLLDINR
jgi:hypothetical protein